MPGLNETITPPQNPQVQETPPTQGVVQGTPAFDQQQFQTSFAGLAPQQQEAAGGIEGFTQKVSSQQQQFKGITQDAAIGNVIGTLPKMVQPKAVNGTEKAQEKVDKTMKELQVVKDRQTTFKQQQQPVSSLQIDTGGNLELQSNLAAIDAEGKQIFDMFEARKATMDDRTRSRVSSIQATFQRIADQTKIANSNRLKSLEIIGGRAGRQRYAPEIQESILSAEEKAGIQRIVEIEAQEQSAIEQAEQANDDMQFGLLMQQVASFKQSRQEKSAEIDKMFNRTMQLEDLAIKKSQAVREDLRQQQEELRFEREGIIFNQEQAQKKVDSLLIGSIPLFDPKTGNYNIPPKDITRIEEELGLVSGMFEGYYQNLWDSQVAAKEGNQAEADIKLIGALKDIPDTKVVTIGGKDYVGLKAVEADKPIKIGNPKDGVWERNADGTYTQV